MIESHSYGKETTSGNPLFDKKIMIIGAGGQVGSEFVRLLKKTSYHFFAYTRKELDITDHERVSSIVKQVMPDVIMNCAAYTDVHEAEREPALAFEVNASAVKRLAQVARQVGASLVNFSTNYVFDGEADVPYAEDAEPNPVNSYGRSKLAGEQVIRQALDKHYIIRTSWIYGLSGDNYLVNLLQAAESQETITIMDVQISSPTYTEDLVFAVMRLLETDQFGTYHMTNSGSCSRYEFASTIMDLAGINKNLKRIIPDHQLARRPAFSVLDHKRIKEVGITPRHWKEALSDCMTAKSGSENGE